MIDNWIRAYRWLSELHPKSEYQFKTQKAVAGVLPGYGSWMESRANDEQMADLRNRLGLSWADIKSPWIASLSGNNRFQTGTSMVSKNLSRLYADVSPEESESVRTRARKYGPWS